MLGKCKLMRTFAETGLELAFISSTRLISALQLFRSQKRIKMEEEVNFIVETGMEIRPAFSLPPSAEIETLKHKIQEQTKIPVEQQTLIYLSAELNDALTIGSYPFERPVARITCVVPAAYFARVVGITVTCPAFRIRLKVNPFAQTVYKLKMQVARFWDLDAKSFQLWHLDMKMIDDVYLFSYCVQDGSDVRFTSPSEYFPLAREVLHLSPS